MKIAKRSLPRLIIHGEKEFYMGWLKDLFTNPFLIITLSSWVIAQFSKIVIYGIINKKIEIERMFGDGGMPSGHAATVCSLATYSAIAYGAGSFEFGIALVFALVVCRDAMGVRRETGKQAVLLNEMRKSMDAHDLATVKLKEFVGHTPMQVLVGGILGILNAILWSVTVF